MLSVFILLVCQKVSSIGVMQILDNVQVLEWMRVLEWMHWMQILGHWCWIGPHQKQGKPRGSKSGMADQKWAQRVKSSQEWPKTNWKQSTTHLTTATGDHPSENVKGTALPLPNEGVVGLGKGCAVRGIMDTLWSVHSAPPRELNCSWSKFGLWKSPGV